MKSTITITLLFATVLLFFSCNEHKKKEYASTADIPVSKEMIAELTAPPHVPAPVGNRNAKKLIVKMEMTHLQYLEQEQTQVYSLQQVD